MVEFYAPWCGHCKNLAPEWKKAAKALKGIMDVVAVDASGDLQSIGAKYGVQGFPTIKFFGGDGKAVDYNGGRDAQAIVNFALEKTSSIAKARLGGKAGGSTGGGGKKKESSGGSGSKPASETGGGKHVVTLTDDNFDEMVFGKDGSGATNAWLVELYAPWCGHCKNLAPEWAAAAAKLKDDPAVKFAAVDATAHNNIASRFGVKGYPTIKVIPVGARSEKEATDYNGGREAPAIIDFATNLAANAPASHAPIKVEQLTSQAAWDEHCGGKTLCLVAILPHILDDKKAGREGRLAALGEAAGKSRGKPYKFFWAEVGQQGKLEVALGSGLVPSIFAVSSEKKIFITHKGAFSADAHAKFAAGLTTNKGAAGALPLPSSFDSAKDIVTVTPWDGKEGKADDSGDSFSLDDLKDL